MGFQDDTKIAGMACVYCVDCLKVKEYQGTRFQYLKSPIEMLPSSAKMYAKPHITADSKLKTIEELLLNPALNKVSAPSLHS
ncbi:unnamed protein product [Malus baccata var. baccata]